MSGNNDSLRAADSTYTKYGRAFIAHLIDLPRLFECVRDCNLEWNSNSRSRGNGSLMWVEVLTG